VGRELARVDENRRNHMIRARLRLFDQGQMPGVQRAHGGDQRNARVVSAALASVIDAPAKFRNGPHDRNV